MGKTLLEKKSKEVLVLDSTTRELLRSIEHKDSRRRFWATVAFLCLITVGIIGIYRQNQLADQNKQHIDCIVKLLATPQRPGTTHKFISDPVQTCNIKFN